MKIQVIGTGCNTCKNLYELTKKAVSELGQKVDVEYLPDVSKLVELGVMSSPVLAIDGKPATVGFVPDLEQIKEIIVKGPTKEKLIGTCDCGGEC